MENREAKDKIQLPQSMHKKNRFPVTCDKSPKWENHKFSTPKNQIRLAKNPFEPLLHEVMHTNIMSPSVFTTLPNKTAVVDDKFCWSIEELATFQPIDIERSPFVQSDATDHVLEAVAQAKINKFFSAKTILPSPAGSTTVSKPLISTISPLAITPSPPPACLDLSSSSIVKTEKFSNKDQQIQQKRRKLCAAATQTYLSLPPVLPAALESMLRSYMHADGQLMGALYADGYSSGEEDASNYSLPTIQDASPLADSPVILKPLLESRFNDQQSKSNWILSPITASQHDDDISGCSGTSIERCTMRNRRTVAKLDFSASHMSVDMSMAPQLCDNSSDLDGLEFHNNSEPSSKSSIRKSFNYSPSSVAPLDNNPPHNTSVTSNGNDSSFFRMEDDYVTFHRSRSVVRDSPSNSNLDNLDMDISFSNTPKSRSASAIRRRLCDSFASFGDQEDDNEEKNDNFENLQGNDDNVEIDSPKKYKLDDNLIRKHDEISSLTDAGYNTASTFEESSLCFEKNTHLFASTPTKMKTSCFPTDE